MVTCFAANVLIRVLLFGWFPLSPDDGARLIPRRRVSRSSRPRTTGRRGSQPRREVGIRREMRRETDGFFFFRRREKNETPRLDAAAATARAEGRGVRA
jgi:hypothetical protein